MRKDDDLVARAELPGVKSEDVEITVRQGVLTISGRREEQTEEECGVYLVKERHSGSFRRNIHLPEGIDEDSIRARFENGVLEVSIQGGAAVQGPKRIQVEAGRGSEGDQDVEITGGEESAGRQGSGGESLGS